MNSVLGEEMNRQNYVPGRLNRRIHTVLTGIFLAVVLTGNGYAATGQYEGNGISFSYPENYELSTSSKKSGEKVLLKNGSDSISIQIMKNVLIDGFDDIVITQVAKRFKEEGHAVSGAKKENKQIPLKVKGESGPISVDAVKYNHSVKISKNDITLDLLQTMFFFSYGEHGYMINYTRVNGKYRDLVKILSSFSFDKKESAEEDDDGGGVY